MPTKRVCTDFIDHVAGEKCDVCGNEVDEYGNTEDDFVNCCFPNCGCDGFRLCMAPSGPNDSSCAMNLERK